MRDKVSDKHESGDIFAHLGISRSSMSAALCCRACGARAGHLMARFWSRTLIASLLVSLHPPHNDQAVGLNISLFCKSDMSGST